MSNKKTSSKVVPSGSESITGIRDTVKRIVKKVADSSVRLVGRPEAKEGIPVVLPTTVEKVKASSAALSLYKKSANSKKSSFHPLFKSSIFHGVDEDMFRTLGMPDTVYIRRIDKNTLSPSLVRLLSSQGRDYFYAVHTADGAPLALVSNRSLAFSEARDQHLSPVSVH